MADDNPVRHVAIKAPQFMETSVNGWFSIMEAQFHLGKVTTEETKFYHILSSLPAETVTRLPQDVLSATTYSTLKAAIVQMFEQTKPEMFEKLISATTLTGKPSVFLQEIRQIAGKVGVADDLVRHKFINALPPTIAPVLAAQQELTLVQLGKLADELVPFAQSCLQVNYAPHQQQTASQHFSGKYSSGKYSNPQNTQKANVPGAIPIGVKPFYSDQRPQVCRAHIYFGTQAKTCKPWCKFPGKTPQLKMQPSSRASSPVREAEEQAENSTGRSS